VKYWAEVIVYDQNNETRKVIKVPLGTVTALKHGLYLIAFRDLFGEVKASLKQWKKDNK
jgi:hypothetical protein